MSIQSDAEVFVGRTRSSSTHLLSPCDFESTSTKALVSIGRKCLVQAALCVASTILVR